MYWKSQDAEGDEYEENAVAGYRTRVATDSRVDDGADDARRDVERECVADDADYREERLELVRLDVLNQPHDHFVVIGGAELAIVPGVDAAAQTLLALAVPVAVVVARLLVVPVAAPAATTHASPVTHPPSSYLMLRPATTSLAAAIHGRGGSLGLGAGHALQRFLLVAQFKVIDFPVLAVLGDQLFVRAALDDGAVAQDKNLISVLDRCAGVERSRASSAPS